MKCELQISFCQEDKFNTLCLHSCFDMLCSFYSYDAYKV